MKGKSLFSHPKPVGVIYLMSLVTSKPWCWPSTPQEPYYRDLDKFTYAFYPETESFIHWGEWFEDEQSILKHYDQQVFSSHSEGLDGALGGCAPDRNEFQGFSLSLSSWIPGREGNICSQRFQLRRFVWNPGSILLTDISGNSKHSDLYTKCWKTLD